MTAHIQPHPHTVYPPLLLGSQCIFNIGFYAVLPFLSVYLREDLLLSSWIIGLIMGVRTFSQQGMFLLGGALADRYGARLIILAGCLVRIAGFILLGTSSTLTFIMLGACLTGVGGALFSPGIEALMAQAGTDSEKKGHKTRAEWFALFAIFGELGAVIGPVIGTWLGGYGFQAMAFSGAGLFILALLVLAYCLPAQAGKTAAIHVAPWWTTFKQKRFVAFMIAYSAYLFSYNQLYFALPVELQRAGATEKDLGPLFILASLLVILLQLPAARFARRLGTAHALPLGFFLLSAAFLSVALSAPMTPPANWLRLAPACCCVILLILGQMMIMPVGMNLIPFFAGHQNLGAYYGALSSVAGAVVLLGNLLLGSIIDMSLTPSVQAMYPWLLLALFPFCSAIALHFICKNLTH